MEFRQLEESVRELAEKVTKDVHNSREINYSLVPLGIYVADDFRRNFIFANSSAQAVAYLKSQGKKVNFVDLGSGTGINCLAAKLAGADKVTGIEYDEQSFCYARELMKKGIRLQSYFRRFSKKRFWKRNL
jgi:methylase of polypeptide subunit release factors